MLTIKQKCVMWKEGSEYLNTMDINKEILLGSPDHLNEIKNHPTQLDTSGA